MPALLWSAFGRPRREIQWRAAHAARELLIRHEEDWLNAAGEQLTDTETLILRRAADAPQHSEALGKQATLIEQFNAPKTSEPSRPPAGEVMQHPLVRLAGTYRKIIIDHVARTAPRTSRPNGRPVARHCRRS
ncbi:hypothetical protein ACWEBX_08080 [Streptomyces sp. NPDC005070]